MNKIFKLIRKEMKSKEIKELHKKLIEIVKGSMCKREIIAKINKLMEQFEE